MSRYTIRSGEHGLQNERDRIAYRMDQARERREKLTEAGEHIPSDPLWRVPGMFPEEWAARLDLVRGFAEQGHCWQWFGDKRGWCKIIDTNFAADPCEYSLTHREDSPWEAKP